MWVCQGAPPSTTEGFVKLQEPQVLTASAVLGDPQVFVEVLGPEPRLSRLEPPFGPSKRRGRHTALAREGERAYQLSLKGGPRPQRLPVTWQTYR